MVGGGIRRDDVAPGISSKNVFAALETLKKKKKSSVKDHKGSSKSKGSAKVLGKEPVAPQEIWVPAPLNKSWADVDDDDDDYYKSAPVLPGWGTAEVQHKDSEAPAEGESDSEEDGLDDGDDDIEEEAEQEQEAPPPVEATVIKPLPAPIASKDPERQLSKKEQKKKELEELDALLAEFCVAPKDEKGDGIAETNAPAVEEKNPEEQKIKDIDNETLTAPPESKTSKKKKVKKEKSAKDPKDAHEPADGNGSDGAAEEPTTEIDMKEKLKKIASVKKKKSGKEMDAAAKIASSEAAARSAKLAAAKKKEKSNYNQQPVR